MNLITEEYNRIKQYINITSVIAICWSIFQLYTVAVGGVHTLIQRPIHIAFAVSLTFLLRPFLVESEGKPKIYDYIVVCSLIAASAYMMYELPRLTTRIGFVHEVMTGDIIAGLIFILALIEASRRLTGMALPIVAITFIIYSFLGPYMPGMLRHRGIGLVNFIDLEFLSPSGLFGIPTGVSADYIFYFVLFAAFLEISGGGELFINIAFRLTGWMRGGPAKAAVVASSLMGTISGSAVANVVGTGVFTIPLMKRSGYSPHFAAAVEAVASTGGQIMPPIMAAGAFVMAEMLGIPFVNVALAAAIPAVLYFVALFFGIDLQAQMEGLKGLPKSELPKMDKIKNKLHLLLPLVFLIYQVISGFSLMTSAFRAIIAIIVVSSFSKETRFNLSKLFNALESGAKKAINVAIPCGIAGLVVGVIIFTGLGIKFADFIIELSAGRLYFAMFIVMLGCIVMGMGMPTTAAYIMGAILFAPALIEMGMLPIAAHLFIFYFSILSTLTPPVALSSYGAAGVADADIKKTSFTAIRLSVIAYIIPYFFAAHPAILFIGDWYRILIVSITAIIGAFSIAVAMIGFLWTKLKWWKRPLLVLGSILLLSGNTATDAIGFFIIIFIFTMQYFFRRKIESQLANS